MGELTADMLKTYFHCCYYFIVIVNIAYNKY